MKNALIICVLLFLSACGPVSEISIEPRNWGAPGVQTTALLSNVVRHIDSEAGVVCYVYMTGTGSGISCLPISETLLDE